MKRFLLVLLGTLLAVAAPVAAQVKFSELPAATSPGNSDLVPMTVGGVTSKVTLGDFKTALGMQPLDADLTSIAALSTTSTGRSLLTLSGYGPGLTMSGSTLSLDTTIIGSPAFARRVVYLSQAITSPGTTILTPLDGTVGNDVSAQIQAILDLANTQGSVHVIVDGAYTATGLRIRSNTHLEIKPGCGLKQTINAATPLIRNYNPSTGAITDKNIVIDGGGILHGNNVSNADRWVPTYGFITITKFAGVSDVTIRDICFVAPTTFATQWTNWQHVTLDNPRVDVGAEAMNRDGHHFNGPGRYCTVRNLNITTHDDGLAFNADDGGGQLIGEEGTYDGEGAYEWYGQAGDITDVLVDGVTFADSYFGIRLLSSISRIDRVVIRNLMGRTRGQAVLIDNYSEGNFVMDPPGPGNFGSILIDNSTVEVTASDYKGAYIYVNGRGEKLKISRIHRSDWTNGLPTVKIDSAARWQSVELDSMSDLPTLPALAGSRATPQNHVRVYGKIAKMTVRNCEWANPLQATITGFPIQFYPGSWVQHLTLHGNTALGYANITGGSGTVSYTSAANNQALSLASLSPWDLPNNLLANTHDHGAVDYPNPVGGVAYARAAAVDSFSGNVRVGARVGFSAPTTGGLILLTMRADNDAWASVDGYSVQWEYGVGVTLYKSVAGTATPLAGRTVNETGAVRVYGIAKTVGGNAVISAEVQRVSDGFWLKSDGTWGELRNGTRHTAVTSIDASSPILGAGRCNVVFYSLYAASAMFVREFEVEAAP